MGYANKAVARCNLMLHAQFAEPYGDNVVTVVPDLRRCGLPERAGSLCSGVGPSIIAAPLVAFSGRYKPKVGQPR